MSTDYYVIKTPPMSTYADTSLSPSALIGGLSSPCEYFVLPKNRFIIIRPLADETTAPSSPSTLNYMTPDIFTGNGGKFFAYVTHFSTMSFEKISYETLPPDFVPTNFFSPIPAITFTTTSISKKSIVTITLNIIFHGLRTVIIVFPPQVKVGEDCYEYSGSEIPIESCTPDTPHNKVIIILENKIYPTTPKVFKVSILALNGDTFGTMDRFSYYIYSTIESNPLVTTGQVYAVLTDGPVLSLSPGVRDIPLFEPEYVPYIEHDEIYPLESCGDLLFEAAFVTSLTEGYKVSITIPSKLSFNSGVFGDFVATPVAILTESTSLSSFGGSLLFRGTVSGSTLSISIPQGVTIPNGSFIKFRVTQAAKTGEDIGLCVKENAPFSQHILIKVIDETDQVKEVGELGSIYLQSTKYKAELRSVLTIASYAMNAWEFVFRLDSSISNFYIEFEMSSGFQDDLGGFSDSTLIPCTSLSFIGNVRECIFFKGLSGTSPPNIWVRNVLPINNSDFIIHIVGPKNPPTGKQPSFTVRFYDSDNKFKGLSRIRANYITASGGISSVSSNDDYPLETNKIHGRDDIVYTLRTAVDIPPNNIILVELDPYCSGKTQNEVAESNYYASGPLGNFFIRRTTSGVPAGGTYTFKNIVCQRTKDLSFNAYHATDLGYVEKRPLKYINTMRAQAAQKNVEVQWKFSSYIEGASNQKLLIYLKFPSIDDINISYGYIMQIAMTNVFVASITNCQVLGEGGFVAEYPRDPVKCEPDADALRILKISNFADIIQDMWIRIYVTVNLGTTTTPNGQAIIRLFASEDNYPNDYVTHSSIDFLVPSTLPSTTPQLTAKLDFPSADAETPYSGKVGSSTFKLSNINLGTTYTFQATDRVIFYIDKAIGITDPPSCALSSGDYKDCTYESTSSSIALWFVNPPTTSTLPNVWITLSTVTWYNSNPTFFILRVVDNSNNILFTSAKLTYEMVPRDFTFGVSNLHNFQNKITEYVFTVNWLTFYYSIEIISIKYTGVDVPGNHLEQIDCACNRNARCYKYDYGIETAIEIHFLQPIGATNVPTCYVPDIKNSVVATFTGRVLNKVDRRVTFSRQATFHFQTYSIETHTLDYGYPANFDPSQEYQFPTKLTSPISTYPADSFMYFDFGQAGPITNGLCNSKPIEDCRVYFLRKYIHVKRIAQTKTPNTNSGPIVRFPAKVYLQDPSKYTVSCIITDSSRNLLSSSSSMITPSYFKPLSVSPTLLLSRPENNIFSTMTIRFTIGNYELPKRVSGQGGIIYLYVTGITNIETSCYASYSHIPLKCVASSSVFRIYSENNNVPASSVIEVIFRAQNPPGPSKLLFYCY